MKTMRDRIMAGAVHLGSHAALMGLTVLMAGSAEARTLAYAANSVDGVVTSLTIAIGEDDTGGKTLGLYRTYGASDCGSDPANWPYFERVGTIAPTTTAVTRPMPEGWGVSTFALRYFLFEEATPGLKYDTRLDYLQSTGKEVINTKLAADATTCFVIDLQVPAALQTSSGSVLGYRTSDYAANSFRLRYGNGANYIEKPTWCYGTKKWSATNSDTTLQIHNRCIVSNDVAKFFVNGNLASELTDAGFTGSGHLGLFAERYCNDEATFCDAGQFRLWSAKFYKGGELVRDFIPVVKDGVNGLWDAENEKFYAPFGTGTFVQGARLDNAELTGERTLSSSGAVYGRVEPGVAFVVTSSGMSLHGFGTFHTPGTTGGALDVYLAYAKSGEALSETNCVWTGWANDGVSRFNTMIDGLEPSTTYNYVIYAKNAAGEKSETVTGSFKTGVIIEVAANEDPVAKVNAATEGAEVRIAEGTYVVSGTMSSFKSRVAIVGQGKGAVLDANYVVDRRIVYSGATHISLKNLTFKNARQESFNTYAGWSGVGAGVRLGANGGNICSILYDWVSNCVFTACTNVNTGAGGLFVEGGCKVVDCTFTDNYAGNGTNNSCPNGGAAYVHGGEDQTQFDHCTFSNNYSVAYAGALGCGSYQGNDKLATNQYGAVLSHCTFRRNSATNGGALIGKIVWMEDCVVSDNQANSGGVIWNGYPDTKTYALRFSDCAFVGNRATTGHGGVLCHDYARNVEFSNCAFAANYAAKAGSVIRSSNGSGSDTALLDCVFACNTNAYDTSSQISAGDTAGLVDAKLGIVSGCVFTNNVVYGPKMVNAQSQLDMRNTVFARNVLMPNSAKSDIQRAILVLRTAGSTLRNVLFANNTNECGYGCALATYCDGTTNDNLTVVGNRCRTAQSNLSVGIYRNTGDNNRFRNCLIADNRNLTDGKLENLFAYGTSQCYYCMEDGTQLNGSSDRNNLWEQSPRFVDAEHEDFSLKRTSKARDAGLLLDWMTSESKDLSGNGRVNGDRPDIGAYECWLKASGFMMLIR